MRVGELAIAVSEERGGDFDEPFRKLELHKNNYNRG